MIEKDKHLVYSYNDFARVVKTNFAVYNRKHHTYPKYILMTKEQQDIVYDALDGIVFPSVVGKVKWIRSYNGLKVKTIRNGRYNGIVK